MALTVNQAWLYGLSHLKMPTTAFSGEEVRSANTLQSIISGYSNWHWLLTAGTNVAVSSGTQDYSLNSADQNKVASLATANLLSGSTQGKELMIWSNPILPKSSDSGRPIGVSLISPTQVRFWPVPAATYTFQHTYYARPVIFTANSESFQCPEAFTDVVKEGMLWKLYELADDDRANEQLKKFDGMLKNLEQAEKRTVGRTR